MSVKAKITVKALISLGVIALAVALPQIVHAAFGAAGGAKFMPMYLPVLLGGCLLGSVWGAGVGILSPLISFGITSVCGNAMPTAVRLPYMVLELAVYGGVSGLFAEKIAKNVIAAFPAVLIASVAGRLTFLGVAAIFSGISPVTFASAWAQVQTGLAALVVQALAVPAAVMLIVYACRKKTDQNTDVDTRR